MVEKSGEKTRWDVENPVKNGINYQAQLVKAEFLKHQQYVGLSPLPQFFVAT